MSKAFSPLSSFIAEILDYRGKTPKKLGSDWVESGYRVLSANNVTQEGLKDLETIRCIDEKTYNKWMKRKVRRGDILLTSEAPAGQAMLWNSDENIVLGQRLFGLRPKEASDAAFLKYYLQSPLAQKVIRWRTSGSTVSGISAKMFDHIAVIAIHDPAARARIGGVLSLLDAKVELNKRINQGLEEITKLLYNFWFVQFNFPISARQAAAMDAPHLEGEPYRSSGGRMVYNEALKLEIPETWDAKELSAICENVRDTIDPDDVSPTTPYVGLEHVPRRRFFLDAWGSAESVTSLKNRFRKGDVLFGKLRPYFHKVVRAPMEGICTSELLVLRATDTKFEGFTGSILFSDVFVDFTSKQWGGAQMPRADWNRMKEFKVACPTDDLLLSFNQKIISLWDLGASNQKQTHHLIELRDWLLPMLMNGQVTVN